MFTRFWNRIQESESIRNATERAVIAHRNAKDATPAPAYWQDTQEAPVPVEYNDDWRVSSDEEEYNADMKKWTGR